MTMKDADAPNYLHKLLRIEFSLLRIAPKSSDSIPKHLAGTLSISVYTVQEMRSEYLVFLKIV